MILLALDMSFESSGLALLDDGRVLASRSWQTVRRGDDPLFDHWRGLLSDAGLTPARVRAAAVGLGPGNYTGLRVALAAVRLWALPDGIPVVGVGSALAVAAAALTDYRRKPGEVIGVAGDARRDAVWRVLFRGTIGPETRERPPRVIPLEEWRRRASAATWISVDLKRTGLPAGAAGLSGDATRAAIEKSAAMLGSIAGIRLRGGLPSPPLRPFYPRPAVPSARPRPDAPSY